MTREEAIERLNIHKSTSVFVDSIAEAIDMAIEALTNVQNMHRGEWIDKEISCNPYPPVFCVECSECGYRVGRETFQENTFNYCLQQAAVSW